MERTAKKNFIIDFFYTAIILLLIYFLCRFLLTYLLPFLFASVIAYSVQPMASFLSRKIKIRQGIIAAILSVVFYLITAFIFAFIIYRIIFFGIGFTDYLPQMLEKLNLLINKFQTVFSNLFNNIPKEFNSALNSIVMKMVDNLTVGIGGFISSSATAIAKKTPPFLVSSIVALVATFYIAKDFKGLSRFVNQIIGSKAGKKVKKIKTILFKSVFKIIKGYFILSAITYVELLLGFLVLRINFAPIIALIIALVDILPVIGTGTVMIPWAVLSVFLGNTQLALGLAVLYVVIVIIRNFLEPKVISTQIGINPLFTLLAMFVGLKVLGVWGLILFPVALIVTIRYYKDEMQEGLSV